MKSIKAALIQQSCSLDQESTVSKTIQLIEYAVSQGVQLVVLQELHTSLYFCQTENTDYFSLGEPIPGPLTDRFGSVAAKHSIVIVGSFFEKRAPGIYHNTAVVFEKDGSIAGKYRKMHIPDDPGFYEKFYFTPGDLGFQPIETSLGKLGVLICWDQWYPEAARLMALAGAEILIYPTAIGWNPADDEMEKKRQLDAWVTIQRGHAIANGIPLLCVNRIGLEQDAQLQSSSIQFWGNSFMAGCQGEILVQGDSDKEECLIAEVDMQRYEYIRTIWPFFRDRRIDAYHDLLLRYSDRK